MTFARTLYSRLDQLIHELMKFGVIGALAFVVDVGVFNLLRHGALSDRPLTAKLISTVLATTVAYFGNRHWTFRHRERSGLKREYTLFFVFNAVGLAIALSCLWISHYVLDFTSAFADNVAANVVGMAFGTIFRFWSYRKFVFVAKPAHTERPTAEPLAA